MSPEMGAVSGSMESGLRTLTSKLAERRVNGISALENVAPNLGNGDMVRQIALPVRKIPQEAGDTTIKMDSGSLALRTAYEK